MQQAKNHTAAYSRTQHAKELFQRFIEEQPADSLAVHFITVLSHTLTRWQASQRMQCAAYLLVPFQQNFITEVQISEQFSPTIAKFVALIDRLTLPDRAPKSARQKSPKAAYTDQLRRLLVHAYSDYEVPLFILAVHRTQAEIIDDLDQNLRQHWADNCGNIYLRLFDLFGLSSDKAEIYRKYLQISHSNLWKEIEEKQLSLQELIRADHQQIQQDLHQLLAERQIKDVEIEPQQWYARHRLQITPDRSNINLHLLQVNMTVPDDAACYLILGLIHHLWPPRQNTHTSRKSSQASEHRFQDFIAQPQANGYRALITMVHFASGRYIKNLEFHIQPRTHLQINQYGLTAARQNTQLNKSTLRSAWWNNTQIRQILHASPPTETANSENILTSQKIAVFLPDGAVLFPIEPGTTLLDIAFRIHSELGPYASVFRLNGIPVEPATQVRHRDLVEIEFNTQRPTLKPEWQQIAFLRSTRQQIRQVLKKNFQHEQKGRELIDRVLARECQICGLYFPKEKIEETLTLIAIRLGYASVALLYEAVEDQIHSPDEITTELIDSELIKHITAEDGTELKAKRIKIAQQWMQEKEPHKWSPSIRVYPGVPIVGKYSEPHGGTGSTLIIYRKDAPQTPTENIIPLQWRSMTDMNEAVALTITALPRSHIIGMIFNALYGVGSDDKHGVIIHKYESEIRNNELFIEAVVYAPAIGTIHKIKASLETIQKSGYITDYKIWQLFPTHKMLVASIADRRQHNPYTIRDVRHAMFFGREQEIQRIIQAINAHKPVVLYGQKRIGKTSLLNRLTDTILPQHCQAIPVMIDVLSLSPLSAIPFLTELADSAIAQIILTQKKQDERRNFRISRLRIKDNHPFKAFGDWVHQVEGELQGKRLVFLVDEFTRAEEEFQSGTLDQHFFQGLQWLVSVSGVSFILCVHDHIIGRENSSITGLLQRSEPVRIDELDANNARRLIQQPLADFYTWDPQVVDRIVRLTNGHPYFIQALCQELISNIAYTDETVITLEPLDHAVRLLLRHSDHYFNHYRHRVLVQEWEILKIIAYITTPDEPWVTSNRIRKAVARYKPEAENLMISKSIGDLRQAGFLDGAEKNNQPAYRISMELFHLYLQRIVTHLTVSRDLQRED